ncbi:c-type cytochrome [Thioclava sp. BHET1]|nr:c-type cytochrome [Thioclava sp. BHET1]
MKALSLLFASLTGAVAGASLLACAALAQDADPALVKTGRYLATAGDCAACHSDPSGGSAFGGGYVVNSPLGKIYGSNITPSKADGIGNWSLQDFSRAVRDGVAPGHHYLYPAMPYTAFAGLSDADVKALYSYFMLGVKPVDHAVTKTDLGFPFNIRPVMLGWDLLFAHGGAVPGSDAAPGGVARGKYLVDTLAHCSTCHTPRNGLMAEESGSFLAGGKVGSWTAPNITSDPVSGIGGWSKTEIATYLSTGALPGKAIAGGEMGTAVQKSFSKLHPDDIEAIAAYIKTVPAVGTGARLPRSGWSKDAAVPADTVEAPLNPTNIASYVTADGMSGAALYNGACASCHGFDGHGTGDKRLPALLGSSAVGSADPSNLVMTITDGIDRDAGGEHVFMPAFGPQFTRAELAKVADYVATSFGDPSHHVTEADVARVYASATQQGWLIANAATLAWIGIVVALLILLALILWLALRRRGGGSGPVRAL